MRAALLAVLVAPLVAVASGCSLFGGDDEVAAASVVSTTVEALPLGRVWDRDVFGPNGPDVFVEVRRIDTVAAGGSVSVFRTASEPDVDRADLPLALVERTPTFGVSPRIDVLDRVVVAVYDDDTFNENDQMFASDTLRLGARLPAGDAPGDERTVTFEDRETRVRLRLRWESDR